MIMFNLALALMPFFLISCFHGAYSFWVAQVHMISEQEVLAVRNIQNDDILLSGLPLLNRTIYISGKQDYKNEFISAMKSTNVQLTFDEKLSSEMQRQIKRSLEVKEKYLTVEEIESWIEAIQIKYRSMVAVKLIGRSFNGRKIYALKLGKRNSLPAALFESGTHAREWLPSASLIGAVNYILEEAFSNGTSPWPGLLDKWSLHFIPMLNPDGYHYTMKNPSNRLWRKNRQKNVDRHCTGIDINRNFPVGFEKNRKPCDEGYSGSRPFSAIETAVFRDYVLSIREGLQAFVSFHCFAQLILLPWAYTNDKPSNYEKLKIVGEEMKRNIWSVRKKDFTVGAAPDIMYIAGGTAFDWVKSLGVPYSYTVELTPTENAIMGFIADESEIKWSVMEVHKAIEALLLKLN